MKQDPDSKPDFFDGEDLPDTARERRRKYPSDDPRRYLEADPQWDHLRPLLRWRVWIVTGGVALLVFIVLSSWIRFFRPYEEGCMESGYVRSIVNTGAIFKTYECELIPDKSLGDTAQYRQPLSVTVPDARMAERLQRAKARKLPVRIVFTRYMGVVPWRGSSPNIVQRLDVADDDLPAPVDSMAIKYGPKPQKQ